MTDLTPYTGPVLAAERFTNSHIDSFCHDDFAGRARFRNASTPPRGDLVSLLAQGEWWRPQHNGRFGPAVRIVDMTDTHRLHTARFALNRAVSVLLMSPEVVKGAPLLVALLTAPPALPLPGAPGWADLLERATHWSTCPRNRDLRVPACAPECKPNTEAWQRRPRELSVDYNGDAAGVSGL